jgi:hypothetical protein
MNLEFPKYFLFPVIKSIMILTSCVFFLYESQKFERNILGALSISNRLLSNVTENAPISNDIDHILVYECFCLLSPNVVTSHGILVETISNYFHYIF